jgi:hypothetical protein
MVGVPSLEQCVLAGGLSGYAGREKVEGAFAKLLRMQSLGTSFCLFKGSAMDIELLRSSLKGK